MQFYNPDANVPADRHAILQTGLWGGIPCAMLIPFAAVFVPHIVYEQVRFGALFVAVHFVMQSFVFVHPAWCTLGCNGPSRIAKSLYILVGSDWQECPLTDIW